MSDQLHFETKILKNNITLHTQVSAVPFARIHIIIPVGSAHSHSMNAGGAPGIAHLLEHLCFSQSKKHPKPHQFETILSESGGDWNAWTTAHHTEFYMEAPATEFSKLLPGFFSHIFEPIFTQEAIVRESSIIENESSLRKYYPSDDEINQYRFTKWMNAESYPKRQLFGLKKDLCAITPEQLSTFHRHYFSPQIHILAGGAIETQKIEAIAKQIKTHANDLSPHYAPLIWGQRTFHTKESNDLDTPLYTWGGFSGQLTPEHFAAMGFICEYLTNPNTGILTQWLRKEKGWSYHISHLLWRDETSSGFMIDIPLPSQTIARRVRKELHERVRTALSDSKAVRATATRLQKESCFAFETIEQRLNEATLDLTSFSRIVTVSEATKLLSKLTPTILQEAYEQHFAPAVSGEVLFVPKK